MFGVRRNLLHYITGLVVVVLNLFTYWRITSVYSHGREKLLKKDLIRSNVGEFALDDEMEETWEQELTKVKAIVPNFRSSVNSRLVDLNRFDELNIEQIVFGIEATEKKEEYLISSSYLKDDVKVTIPFDVELNFKKLGLSSKGKILQTYHAFTILKQVCSTCTNENMKKKKKKKSRTPYILVDDDISMCEDTQVYFSYVIDYFMRNYDYIGVIRVGVGSNGIILSCEQLCRFVQYYENQINLMEQKILKPDEKIDEEPNELFWHYDELLDDFFFEFSPNYTYTTFHHNLFYHDNEAESTIKNQAHETLQYGFCNKPIFSPNKHKYFQSECAHHAFHPCKLSNGLHPKMSNVPVLENTPSVHFCQPVTAQEVDNLVVKYGKGDCNTICKTGKIAHEKYSQYADVELSCNPKFMGLISSPSFLKSLSICNNIRDDVWYIVGKHMPSYFRSGKSCFQRAYPCSNMDTFCSQIPPGRGGGQRICPCN